MERGAGYLTPQGVKFTKDHPYQLVEEEDVPSLMELGKFRVALKDEIRSYYNIENNTMSQEE